MGRATDPLAPGNLLAGWLAALAGLPLAVMAAVFGQAVGAMVGRCAWIGMTVPLDRQPWALVNEPTLNFASTPAATGYWLGSMILPAIFAFTIVGFLPRSRTIWSELAAIELAFGMAVGGLGWLPLLDPSDGHLARWLDLHGLSPYFLAVPPVVGAAAVLPGLLRLLSLDRAARRSHGAVRRVTVVVLSLGPVVVLWIGLGSMAAGRFRSFPAAGAAVPLAAALLISAVFTVEPWVYPMEANRVRTVVLLAVVVLAGSALLWIGGRPLPWQRSAGILWAPPDAYNNVRAWVTPLELFTRR